MPTMPSEHCVRADGRVVIPDPHVAGFGADHPPYRVAGLDLSLTSTGIAVVGENGFPPYLARVQPAGLGGHGRIDVIRDAVRQLTMPADLVVIEGPSYGSVTGHQHERAGLWWIITRMLWRAKVPCAVVAPAALKRYALGKGGGKDTGKDQVLAAAIRRYPMAEADGNDVADALILAAMGAHHLGFLLAPVPKANAAALTGVDWPDLPAPTREEQPS